MREIAIIPEPKKIEVEEGRFVLSGQVKCFVFCDSNEADYAAGLLSEYVKAHGGPNLPTEKIEASNGSYSIVIASERPEPPAGPTTPRPEGYELTVTREQAAITASDAAGLFYGVQTLIQLIARDKPLSVPGGQIGDFRDLPIRGIHVNLWSMTPTYEYLEEFFRRLSRFKINTVLLEYEDKFPYEKHPALRHPLALTKEQVESLLRTAKAHHIEVIPLVQSFGHLTYVLKHPEYAHLAEQADSTMSDLIPQAWQYCPLEPASLEMFADMAGEVMDLHADCRYFHIGADETFHLGQCDRCREFAEKHGKSKLFVDYVNKVGEFIKSKGRTPILWYDYLTNYPQETEGLSRDFLIMYWQYRTGGASAPFVRWAGLEFSGRQLFDQVPDHVLEIFRPYWDEGDGQFPEKIKGFPYIKYFHDKGFKVLGAARYQGDWRIRVPNTTAFCEALADEGAEGMVNTHWPGRTIYPLFYSGGEPLEVSWLPILATAEAAWSPGLSSRERFDRKFASAFLGAEAEADALVRSMYMMGGIINADTAGEVERRSRQCLSLLAGVKDKAADNRLFLDYMELTAAVRAAQAGRTAVLADVEKAILAHFDREKFSQWQASEVPHWTGFLSPGSVPEGLDQAGIGLAQIDEAIEKLVKVGAEIEQIKEQCRTVLARTLRAGEIKTILDNPLPGEEKVQEYLGQLQMIRTCLKVEQYFRDNFV